MQCMQCDPLRCAALRCAAIVLLLRCDAATHMYHDSANPSAMMSPISATMPLTMK
jgi:hypothetical protein